MHRIYIGDTFIYNFLNAAGVCVMLFSSLFYYKSKRNAMGLYAKIITFFTSRVNEKFGKSVEMFFFAIESLLAAYIVNLTVNNFNRSFGRFIGTGANYFGLLLTILFFWLVFSFLIMANPLKILDISTMYLPILLIFFKIACYCAGCCYGIPWEYGPYNHHPDHPGNQVPVQLIEAFWALLIFFFLLWYRKRAKTGSLFPIYMILYSATRFLSEFFRNEENVLGPLKIYHILCLVGIAYGLFHLFFLHFYRDTINSVFDGLYGKVDAKIIGLETAKANRMAEEKARQEAERLERLEKAKKARAKAKARKK